MKRYQLLLLLSLILITALPTRLVGQIPCGASYARIIEEGDAFLKLGIYKEAFEKYRAARGCAEAEHQILDKKTADVLSAVDGEREKADKSAAMARQQQRKAEAALLKAEAATAKAEAAEKKANAVLDKIYFYQDRFGLAYENGRYGFIDKNLQTRIGFKYFEAMPFDYTGFAWVKRWDDHQKQLEFVIDTFGNEYALAYDGTEMNETITALDLRNRDLDSVPLDVFRHTQIKILMLAGNQLKQLPPEIGNLKNLIFLGLSRNQLTQLPPELEYLENLSVFQAFENQLTTVSPKLGELKSLTSLDLSNNQLVELPTEIGALKNLQSLNLGSSEKSTIKNQLASLPREIVRLKNLQELSLINNPMSEKYIEGFRTAMPWCKIDF